MGAEEAAAAGITNDVNEKLHSAINDIDEGTNWLHAIIYGDAGVGKTVLAARFAYAMRRKMLLISTDNGYAAIANHPELVPWVKHIEYTSPKRLQALALAIRYQAPGFEQYGSVCLDTTSGVCDEYIDHLELEYNATGKQGGRDKLTPKRSSSKLPTLEMASGEDYKGLRMFMRPIIMNIAKAPINSFWITHVREPYYMETAEAKKSNEVVAMRPDLTDKVYKALTYYTQVMAHMTMSVNGRRELNCKASNEYRTKSRIKELYDKRVSDNEFIKIVADWCIRRGQEVGE